MATQSTTRTGPISASHTILKLDKENFNWVNKIAQTRVDCRR